VPVDRITVKWQLESMKWSSAVVRYTADLGCSEQKTHGMRSKV
jgi:hypothetical protein